MRPLRIQRTESKESPFISTRSEVVYTLVTGSHLPNGPLKSNPSPVLYVIFYSLLLQDGVSSGKSFF